MDRQQMIEEIEIKLWCRTKVSSYKVDLFNIKDVGEVILEDFVTPVSLSRVLSELDKGNGFPNQSGYVYFQGEIYNQDIYDDGDRYDFHLDRNHICPRKLLNEDGSDAMLDDQSDHTIEALHKLLVRK